MRRVVLKHNKVLHGLTIHQLLILYVVDRLGDATSNEIADEYAAVTNIEMAYNFQYIMPRRLHKQGLLHASQVKSDRGQWVYCWRLTSKGKELLKSGLTLMSAFTRKK